MKAMVLAAGMGERMRPLTDYLPKPLLPIVNRPVMGHVLAHLARHGFTEVIANVCYRAHDIMETLGNGSEFGVRLSYQVEDQLWGSAGSVKRAEAFFGDETFLVIGADDLTDMDLSDLLERHRRAGAVASIGLAEVEDTSQYGIVVTDPAGHIERFVEKPKGRAPSDTANTQIYLFEPGILNAIPSGEWYDFGFGVFPDLVARGLPFYGFSLPGYWRDIGSLEAYLDAQREVLCGGADIEIPGAPVGPGIWVGQGCDIHTTARLEAPVVVGGGCRVGSSAVLASATAVAPGVEIQAGTRLDGCVVWDEARVPVGEHIRRAVIGRQGVMVRSGAHGAKGYPTRRARGGSYGLTPKRLQQGGPPPN